MIITIGEVYKNQYEYLFQDHPNCNEIVEKLITGIGSKEEIKTWFEEANYYTIRNFSQFQEK